MPTHRIRIGSLPRGEPLSDEGEGLRLRDLLLRALSRGQAPPVAVALRARRVDLVDLRDAAATGMTLEAFLAGLTRAEVPDDGPPEAVGVLGAFRPRDGGVPVALAFLEWADCRWWCWRAALAAAGGGVRDDTVTVRSAVEGDRLPDGLGRWWSLGRRTGARVALRPAGDDEAPLDAPPLVH